MTGIKIIGVKVVGLCSKCRKEGDEVPVNIYGQTIPDKDISCINKAFGDCEGDVGVRECKNCSSTRVDKKNKCDECGYENEL